VHRLRDIGAVNAVMIRHGRLVVVLDRRQVRQQGLGLDLQLRDQTQFLLRVPTDHSDMQLFVDRVSLLDARFRKLCGVARSLCDT